MTISHKDRLAIAALLNGATQAQAGDAAGYSPRTIGRRMDDADFRAELVRASEETFNRVCRSVASGALIGVRVLVEIAADKSEPTSARVAAAGKLVDTAVGKRLTISGPAGGPIEVTATTPQDELIARLERLAPRAIETTATNA